MDVLCYLVHKRIVHMYVCMCVLDKRPSSEFTLRFYPYCGRGRKNIWCTLTLSCFPVPSCVLIQCGDSASGEPGGSLLSGQQDSQQDLLPSWNEDVMSDAVTQEVIQLKCQQ